MELNQLSPDPERSTGYQLRFVNKADNNEDSSALHETVSKGRIEDLKVLLKTADIDLNYKTKIGNTALMLAIKKMRDLNKLQYYVEKDLTTEKLTRINLLEEMIKLLLKGGCNANTGDKCGVTPIYLAIEQGFKRVVEIIVHYAKEPIDVLLKSVNTDNLLIGIVRHMGYCASPKSDFNWCIDLLLQYTEVNINKTDFKYDSALHYAARNGDDNIVLKLLRHGACIRLQNNLGDFPLSDINAKTLETYMDECITTNSFHGYRPNDDNYAIHMDYGFLVHPDSLGENKDKKAHNTWTEDEEDSVKENDAVSAPETDALLYMTHNEELCPLLKHPVITSFLYLKWQRIRRLAYANITFYSLLCLCLILYIILGYTDKEGQSDSIKALNIVTRVGAMIGLLLLIIRELCQLVLSPSKYVKSIGNLMEIVLIVITALILLHDSAQESTKQILSAVAILISSAELLLLIGQFPASSTYMLILKTVAWNFLKCLLWYCILIIAFALSFYTLFREVKENQTPTPTTLNNTGNEEGEQFFNDPFRAFFKTMVMLTGEFDAGSIKFNSSPVTSHVIFIVFVFMIPIVLSNLLNGLAISDIQEIRADAELKEFIYRVKLIYYFEEVLLGNGKRSKYRSKFWPWLTLHLRGIHPCLLKLKAIFIKPFAKRICLFPHFLPKHRIIVKPRQGNKIEIPHPKPSYDEDEEDDVDLEAFEHVFGCFERCQNYKLDGEIVKNAKLVIREKINVTNEKRIQNLEVKIESMDITSNKILQILEKINQSVSSDIN